MNQRLKYSALTLGIALIFLSNGCQNTTEVRTPLIQTSMQNDSTLWYADSVTQFGITFYFDGEYPVGQFANGDYWVAGKDLQITRITPDFDGSNYGWEVNPVVEGGHGFQAGGYGGGFDPHLVPDLPYAPKLPIESIVKTTPSGKSRSCIQQAVVLTVLDEIPVDNGSTLFRPPYVGIDKPIYSVRGLRTELLPTYKSVEHMPTLTTVTEYFDALWMDHKQGQTGRGIRPEAVMDNYQPANNSPVTETAFRLMMDDPVEDKMPALIRYVQYGLDKIHMMYLGHTWPAGGGHQPGHRIGPAFAAVLLDLEEAKTFLKKADFFHGQRLFSIGLNTDNLTLWGAPDASEEGYWDYLRGLGGNRSGIDPYGYIDGGDIEEGAYKIITSQFHKGEILATHLMPTLKDAWNMEEWELMRNYTDRWVYHGDWAMPDPYAGIDENGTYSIDFGPAPDDQSGAIKGNGRFPHMHGKNKDGGQYYSEYVASMWNAYRSHTPEAKEQSPFVTIIQPLEGQKVTGQLKLYASAFGIHGIQSVHFTLDGKNIGAAEQVATNEENVNPPYILEWDSNEVANGEHTLQAITTDKAGNVDKSLLVTISVQQ